MGPRLLPVAGEGRPCRFDTFRPGIPRHVTVYRYRLIESDGADLGPFVTGSDSWKPGRIILQPGGDYEVTAVVEAEPGENFGAYLVVRRFDGAP